MDGWELELNVGESIQIGDVRVTVLGTDRDRVSLRIETSEDEWDESFTVASSQVDLP